MVFIPVSQAKPGDQLEQDVMTALGGVLMYKGRTLSVRDLDVLDAFLIKSVAVLNSYTVPVTDIAGNRSDMPDSKNSEPTINQSAMRHAGKFQHDAGFVESWLQMVNLMKNVYKTTGATKLPILELRQQMEWLLGQIEHYSPVCFHPQVKEMLQGNEEDYLFHKSVAVALTSYLIGQWSGYPSKEGMQVALSGLLHDIGKAKVDNDVWYKKGLLTDSEKIEMRKHTQYGYELLRNVPAINDGVKLAALQHHERLDGSGYPLGVKGDRIHPYAKIVAIADIFHAMTQNRVYKRASSPYMALERLKEDSFGKLDPQLVRTFILKVAQMHQNAFVKLNDGRVGRIVFTEDSYLTRPWVSVDGGIIQLTLEKQIWIEEVLSVY
ncbi:HD-GYP domain-containing protein [Paenibacillus alvei]|uniref:HD-GYP domain-containing protein n=1 Tax=Paenibacillus alvei TaxID=44250 RepID=UPI000287F762|nr:HD-GYP domain-containing protein [Paenibacillus alvei]EJW18827.1 metal dependent phosphohydrolase [Paenibacillus alvei DSM 29]MBG9734366.1 HD family phosphohydrolase [Paenibacillus alvei]MBG9744332.1 HD family phosphohydrolase [Paenibacillus alvei]MCY9540000.1 HD-GYP domain-containing protein [Paenibacillus alvei]MCY9577980.1 HD-GYP domain-containing protein [Paenibacillus alvei]